MKKIVVVLCLLMIVLPICPMLSKPVKASTTHYGWMYDTIADGPGSNRQPSLATDSNGYLYLADNYYHSYDRKYGYRLLKSTDNGQTWSLIATWETPDFDTKIRNIAIDPTYDYIYLSYENDLDSSHSWVGVYTYNTAGSLLWSKTIAGESEGVYINPCVACEYQFGSANRVYFAYENVSSSADRDLFFAKSTTHGASFSTYARESSSLASTASPWITEADGLIYIAYIESATYGNGEGQVYVDFSADAGVSWQTAAHIDSEFHPWCRKPVVAASHGGGSAVVAYEYDIWSSSTDVDVDSTYSKDYGSTWRGPVPVANSPFNETSPALSVDGQGSTSNSVYGYYHIAYYNGSSDTYGTYNGEVMYARAPADNPEPWYKLVYGPSPINDGPPYHAWSDGNCFAVTTQLRSDGKWYPIVAWPDTLYPSDCVPITIFTTTPQARANLASSEDNDATVNLGSIIFDGTTYALPDYACKEAGLGTYQASYTPAYGYAFDHWVTTTGVSVSDTHANPTTVTITNIGGATPFGTLTAVYARAREYLVVRGNDNGIYYRSYARSTWTGWTKLPGTTVMSPASCVFNGKLQIVVVGADGTSLWYGNVDLGTSSFSGWTQLTGATPSAPTLASNGTALCLVVRGMDNRIYCSWYTSSWGPWKAVPTGTTCDGPAATMLGDVLHIVVRGMDGSSLWHIIVDSNGQVLRDWIGIDGATGSKPVLTAWQAANAPVSSALPMVPPPPTPIPVRLIVTGLDNRIYMRNYLWTSDAWGAWYVVPTGATSCGPGATTLGDSAQTSEVHIVVCGTDGSSLWHCSMTTADSTFSAWTKLDGSTPSAPTLAS